MLIFLVILLILIVVFRRKIWEKLPATAKTKLVSIKHSIFWNMFIRTLLEMFYPVMIAQLNLIRKHHTEPKQLIGPIVQVIVFIAFLVFTFFFMKKHRDDVENK